MKSNNIQWHKIIQLARKIYTLSPWKWFDERDIFGVNIPGKNLNYYISIMGSVNQVFAISAYKGDTALYQFWDLMDIDMEERAEKLIEIPQLMLSFEIINDQNYEDRKKMKLKGLDVKTGNNCILFHELVPGYLPKIIDDDKVNEFSILLEQTLDVINRSKKDMYFIHPEEHDDEMYLVRQKKKVGNQDKWQDIYQRIKPQSYKIPVKYPPDGLDKLISLPKKPVVFQCGFFLIPNPVNDEVTGPYFPYMLLLINKMNGIAEDFQLMTPQPDLKSMHGNIPQVFLEILNNQPFKPFKIEISSTLLDTLLTGILSQAGIEVKMMPKLSVLEQAKINIVNKL